MDMPRSGNSTIVRADNDPPDPIAVIDSHAVPDVPSAPPAEASWISRDWRYAVLRRTMMALSRLSPTTAGDLFGCVRCTPPRTRPEIEGARWLARAQPLALLLPGQDSGVCTSRGGPPL